MNAIFGWILVVVGVAAFVAITKHFNRRDTARIARLLPPNKRYLVLG